MVLTFDEFTEASRTLDMVLAETETADVRLKIEQSVEGIPEDKRRAYLNHLNTLFLNVLLNRLDELGERARERSEEARRVISALI